MANFRAERLFIRVAGTLDFDPNAGIDAAEFASVMMSDDAAWDRPALEDFSFAPGDIPKWWSAVEGLTTVRAVISGVEAQLGSAGGVTKAELQSNIDLLRLVEDVLDTIDMKGFKFSLSVRDLA